jgi:hypothetical protein
LSKPEQNDERANYLHHGAKLPQPQLVGLWILCTEEAMDRLAQDLTLGIDTLGFNPYTHLAVFPVIGCSISAMAPKPAAVIAGLSSL